MAVSEALQNLALQSVRNLPADQGAWSRLWPLLVTAGLTLLVLGAVQFYIVPVVETRKRREDRWEENVLALGELLTFEFEKVVDDLSRTLYRMSSLEELKGVDDVDLVRLDERIRANNDSVYEASDAHRALRGRVSWLAERIVSIAPTAQALLKFRMRELGLSLGELEALAFQYRYVDETVPTQDQIKKASDADHKVLKELIDEVTALASGKPVRPSTKSGRALKGVRTRLRKVRARAQRASNGDLPSDTRNPSA